MSGLLLTIVFGAFLVYSLYGVVLAYHWLRYGASASLLTLSLGTYGVVGGYLLLVALISAL